MAAAGESKHVLEMVQANGTDESCVTFVLHDEDHTLGNSLRYMIMKNPEVEFCGYSITHPSESKINFRIQTRNRIPAVEPFRRGLAELMDVCQHVLNRFEPAMGMAVTFWLHIDATCHFPRATSSLTPVTPKDATAAPI